jgi:hypothetical protein
LQITSNPNDAQVQIDGVAAGKTPLNVTVAPGKHVVSISKAGYSDWSKNLDLSTGKVIIEAVLRATVRGLAQ